MAIHSRILAWKIPWTGEDNHKEEENLDYASKPGAPGWYLKSLSGTRSPALGAWPRAARGWGGDCSGPRPTLPGAQDAAPTLPLRAAFRTRRAKVIQVSPAPAGSEEGGPRGRFSFCAGHCPSLCHP